MKVHVKRFGGQLPTLQPERVLDLAKMDAGSVKAVQALVKRGAQKAARVPDAYSYKLSLEKDDGSRESVTVSETEIPDELLKHLP
jgi:hypothetical protein